MHPFISCYIMLYLCMYNLAKGRFTCQRQSHYIRGLKPEKHAPSRKEAQRQYATTRHTAKSWQEFHGNTAVYSAHFMYEQMMTIIESWKTQLGAFPVAGNSTTTGQDAPQHTSPLVIDVTVATSQLKFVSVL